MMSGRVVVVVVLAVAVLLVAAPGMEGALTCPVVYNALTPCLSYVGSGGAMPAACCKGVRDMLAAARTVADRRGACDCIKRVASGVSGPSVALAASIPGKCGIPFPYKISPSTDCNRVN